MRRTSILTAILVGWSALGGVARPDAAPPRYEGVWSAPSLSHPREPIIITLTPDGRAAEKIGDFRGAGVWKTVDGAARIDWASGWLGLLRRTPQGAYELRTWKSGVSPQGRPSDTQPARRISN